MNWMKKDPLEQEDEEAVEDDEEEEGTNQKQERDFQKGKDVKVLVEASSAMWDSTGDIHEGNEEENDEFLILLQ